MYISSVKCMEISMYNNWSKMLFFRFTTGQIRGIVALYTAPAFHGDAKVKKDLTNLALAIILILTGFNLTRALSTVNLSNLILHQIFLLHGICTYKIPFVNLFTLSLCHSLFLPSHAFYIHAGYFSIGIIFMYQRILPCFLF